MMSNNVFPVVPETPEDNKEVHNISRRRSRRSSTYFNSISSESLRKHQLQRKENKITKILETPIQDEPQHGPKSRNRVTKINETDLGQSFESGKGEGEDDLPVNKHPVFRGGHVNDIESEDTFVQFVAATQDLASTHMEDKVGQWLINNKDNLLQEEPTPLTTKKNRSDDSLCSVILNQEHLKQNLAASSSTSSTTPKTTTKRRSSSLFQEHLKQNLATSPSTSETTPKTTIKRRRSSLFVEHLNQSKRKSPRRVLDVSKFSSQSTIVSEKTRTSISRAIGILDNPNDVQNNENKDESDHEVVFASGPCTSSSSSLPQRGYNDFSSDSAKALMAEFERKAKLQEQEEIDKRNKSGDSVSEEKANDEEDLPSTQPSTDPMLDGVVAFVEVRTRHENRSKCVEEEVIALGGKVCPRLNKTVTHMIFKDGTLANYKKAKKLGLHIVSVTWLEACKENKGKVSEDLYPSISKERYDSPGLFPKLRKAKSMQPEADEDIVLKKIRKRRKKMNKEDTEESCTTPKMPKMRFPIPLDYYNSPRPPPPPELDENGQKKESLMDILEEVSSPMFLQNSPEKRLSTSCLSDFTSPTSDDLNTPLARKIVNRIYLLNSEKAKKDRPNQVDAQESHEKDLQNISGLSGVGVLEHNSNRVGRSNRRSVTLKPINYSLDISDDNDDSDANDNRPHRKNDKTNCSRTNRRKSRGRPRKVSQNREKEISTSSSVGILIPTSCEQSNEEVPKEMQKRDEVTIETESVKKIDNSIPRPRSRGRPRKTPTSTTAEVRNQTVAKTSFAPSSILSDDESEIEEPASDAVQVPLSAPNEVRRSRGRPRKSQTNESQVSNDISSVASMSRTRGSPKNKETTAVKRGRGRPRSNRKRSNAEREEDQDDSQTEKTEIPVKTKKKKYSSIKKLRPLLTQQNFILSETATNTPPTILSKPELHKVHTHNSKKRIIEEKTKKSTKICTKGSEKFALPAIPPIKVKKKREPRKSSFEFIKESDLKFLKSRKAKPPSLNQIVCTSMNKDDQEITRQVVSKLGRYKLAKNVTSETSHVITGENRRTINLLKGILRGCWIVNKKWIYESLEANKWVDEEQFELTEFSEAVRVCRIEKASFGPSVYHSRLFASCGPIYISRKCKAPHREMKELVVLAGGKVANLARVATIVVGENLEEEEEVFCVNESWFFDCIQRNQLLPYHTYEFS